MSVWRDATASGTLTIEGYGAVNFTPGTSQSAELSKTGVVYVNRVLPSLARELFSQTPVLN